MTAILTDKQVLIDQINAGVRDALMPLSDLLREEGDDVGADCFLWMWKMGRWPKWENAKDSLLLIQEDGYRFCCSDFQARIDEDHFIGSLPKWNFAHALDITCAPTIFGAFSNFLERMWRRSPDHVAKLMEELT